RGDRVRALLCDGREQSRRDPSREQGVSRSCKSMRRKTGFNMKNRYVVRYTGLAPRDREYLLESYTQQWGDRGEKMADDLIANYAGMKGKFVKLGGHTTDDLTEAMVIGWNNHSRWAGRQYELVPVKIV